MKKVEITSEVRENLEVLAELLPRHQCEFYVNSRARNATLLRRADFDALKEAGEFKDGPYKDAFGSGYGEPYNPNRQAFGTLKDGRVVYCETSKAMMERVEAYFESISEEE